jgi:hypothetical protein
MLLAVGTNQRQEAKPMCDKCRQMFGISCDVFLGREFEQRDDPVEVVESFTNGALGALYNRLAQVGINEADAKNLHDAVLKCISEMNTRAMRQRIGGDMIPANALLN